MVTARVRSRVRRVAGFTYLVVLIVVAIMGVELALVGTLWHSAAQRAKEAQLLYIGEQYRRGIERYYFSGPRQYPPSLADLLQDPRKANIRRYLRALYPDPMSPNAWGIVRAPDGGIMGVYSRSQAQPFKTANFPPGDSSFAGAKKYSDWKFVYLPPAGNTVPRTASAQR